MGLKSKRKNIYVLGFANTQEAVFLFNSRLTGWKSRTKEAAMITKFVGAIVVLLLMCHVPQGWAALTDEEKQEILDVQNRFRRRVSPIATNMAKLVRAQCSHSSGSRHYKFYTS